MATNTNNGGATASSYYYSNYPRQTAADDEQDKTIMTIVLPVFVVGILLLKLLCFCTEKDREEEEQEDAGGGNGAGRQRQRSREAAGSWADDEAAVDVAPALAAEPQLVCTYRKADGWGDDASCGVCLAELADGDVLRVLPACLHYFHADCVGEWLRTQGTCPLCRAPLVAAAAAT